MRPDPATIRPAVAAYIARYGPDVSMVDLRGFVRSNTGLKVDSGTLTRFLKESGYQREGYRRIDTCPGKSLFYVKAPA